MPKPPKKDVLINVRVTSDERADFATILSERGETASDVLRAAMLRYVRRHGPACGVGVKTSD